MEIQNASIFFCVLPGFIARKPRTEKRASMAKRSPSQHRCIVDIFNDYDLLKFASFSALTGFESMILYDRLFVLFCMIPWMGKNGSEYSAAQKICRLFFERDG